jgi:hypothetical protein
MDLRAISLTHNVHLLSERSWSLNKASNWPLKPFSCEPHGYNETQPLQGANPNLSVSSLIELSPANLQEVNNIHGTRWLTLQPSCRRAAARAVPETSESTAGITYPSLGNSKAIYPSLLKSHPTNPSSQTSHALSPQPLLEENDQLKQVKQGYLITSSSQFSTWTARRKKELHTMRLQVTLHLGL